MQSEPLLKDAVDAFAGGDLDRARALAEEALASAPSPEWHHLLGLIHCRLGNAAAGVEQLQAAARGRPGNAAFQVMLARALVDAGRGAELLTMPEPGPITSQATLALWQARAEAAAAVGDRQRAVQAWSILCGANPSEVRAWVNLGRSHLALSQYADAEAAFLRALAAAPTNIDALSELGLTYHRTNQYARLASMLDKAADEGVAKDNLAYLWSLRSYREGKLDLAREQLKSAPEGKDAARILRLRAKIADAAGDPGQAFDAATAMNQSVPGFRSWLDRAHVYRGRLKQLGLAMTREWAAGIKQLDAGEQRASPIFLVGFPRSGTTLLDTLLMGHPDLAVLEEISALPDASSGSGTLVELPAWPLAELQNVRDRYLTQIARHSAFGDAKRLVDKFPLNMQAAPLIHAAFPNSPVVFVQRHPCDAVLSGFMRNFEPNLGMASFLDLEAAADLYDSLLSIWTTSVELLGMNVQTVVYERLVEEPEPVLRTLLQSLDMEWDERVLNHRATARLRGPISTDSYGRIAEPISASAVGRWRNYREQLEPVLPVLLPWANRLGYEV